MAIQWKRRLAAGLVLAVLPLIMTAGSLYFHCEEVCAAQVIKEEKGPYGCLTWPQNLNAVRSEVEIFKKIPKDLRADTPIANAIYRNTHVYTNSLMLDMRQWQAEKPLFYRVRAYDLDGHPIGPYSQPADVESALFKTERNAPIPHDPYGKGYGSVLLYPVYAYTGNPNAARYEIEVTSKYPENLHGFSPSVHRIYAAKTELTDLYDDAPRTGTYYWRVRGMDSAGKPVGEWSLPQEIKNPVKHWKVAVYGDSISHGGGHLSFGPADLAYSYESYLDFPSINLSQSGDTSEAMVKRFEKDVLPFSPEYLLILGGTNSLRAGVPAADVIFDLKEIQRKCREHGITPILMTLPPINPENIQKAFDEPTYEGWKASFDEVNAFIRGEVHIDTAAPFEEMEELPTWLALDGIHGDWNMKRMMAEVINREFLKIMAGEYCGLSIFGLGAEVRNVP